MAKAKKKEEMGNELETKLKQVLELAESNAKAIQELKESCQKGFAEFHTTLMTLKERNRLR
jgi:hypothetical protein